jgi:hypothetical protein
MREREGPVSWLEAACAPPSRALLPSGAAGARASAERAGPAACCRASYSGGAAPDLHRLPNGPLASVFSAPLYPPSANGASPSIGGRQVQRWHCIRISRQVSQTCRSARYKHLLGPITSITQLTASMSSVAPHHNGAAGAAEASFSPRPNRAARNGAVPTGLSGNLRRAAHMPARLREALALAADDAQIRTVERLATAVRCDRRTLWAHWRKTFGRSHELRLQDFLHWLLLLRALRHKRAGTAWTRIADDVGVHPHTLSRLARQLTGQPLRSLAEQGHPAVLRHFETNVLPPLLTPRPRETASAP